MSINPYTELVEQSKKSGDPHATYIYEQKAEAYGEALATAQETVHILQKRIDDIEKAEKVHYRESRKEIKEIKQQIIQFEKDWILPIIRGNNNAGNNKQA